MSDIADLPNFSPPERPYDSAMLKVLRTWFPPTFSGMDHIDPDQPSLFVGNHTIYGLVDIPLMQAELYNQHGIWLRGLADHLHYKIPAWAKYLESSGAIRGTRPLCDAAMNQGDNIVVFPGGGREVMKRKGEKYHLVWKERLGFVKLAASHAYPIQPFASVGADDAWDILLDAGNFERSRFRSLFEKSAFWKATKNGEEIPPLTRGMGLTAVPRPEPFYFAFGPAIETAEFQDFVDDDDAMRSLRDIVAESVNELIAEAMEARDSAPRRGFFWELLRKF